MLRVAIATSGPAKSIATNVSAAEMRGSFFKWAYGTCGSVNHLSCTMLQKSLELMIVMAPSAANESLQSGWNICPIASELHALPAATYPFHIAVDTSVKLDGRILCIGSLAVAIEETLHVAEMIIQNESSLSIVTNSVTILDNSTSLIFAYAHVSEMIDG